MVNFKIKILLSLSFVICCFCITSNVFSQAKKSADIIAEGGAKIKVRPDIAVLSLTIAKTDSIEKEVIRNLNTEMDALVKVLYKLGFTNKTVKISDYDISSNKYRAEEDTKKYTATNGLKLEFKMDTKLIDAIYNEIQQAGLTDLDIAFDSKVSDSLEKQTRYLLVQQAIEDAKANASNIAKTLNIKLLGIKQVSKFKEMLFNQAMEINMVKFTPGKLVVNNEISFNSSFDKFEVEDVELEEKITIVYEISN